MNPILSTQSKRFPYFLAAVLLAGCGGASGDPPASPPSHRLGAPLQAEAQCPGIDLVARQNLVYVSDQGSDTGVCGQSAATACKSIAQGIANCNGPSCSVLVRHGRYAITASIVLRDGVDLNGSCRFGGEPDRKYRSVIAGGPVPGTRGLVGR